MKGRGDEGEGRGDEGEGSVNDDIVTGVDDGRVERINDDIVEMLTSNQKIQHYHSIHSGIIMEVKEESGRGGYGRELVVIVLYLTINKFSGWPQ